MPVVGKRLKGWSVEAKCLLAIALALGLSFVFAIVLVQWIASRLVAETVRTTARNYTAIALHEAHEELQTKTLGQVQWSDRYARSEVSWLLPPGRSPPSQVLWQSIEREFDQESVEKISRVLAAEASTAPSEAAVERPPVWSGPVEQPVFAEAGPIGDWYYYYQPIWFGQHCQGCHNLPDGPAAAGSTPHVVARVRLPYRDTRVWTIWTNSLMYAVAIASSAIALLMVHRILKRLVIRPLGYLRDVSDRIAAGQTNLRSEIDTRDEFQALSDSFNKTIRHLVSTQDDLRTVNTQLDGKIDEMAAINLQLFEANRLKNDFLASMSHELRTPLNSILGFSEMLASADGLNDRQRRWAGNIQNSGRTLLDLINDILDLAKIEAGKMNVRLEKFDIAELIRQQIELVRPLSDSRNLDLTFEGTGQNESVRVEQDRGKLQQILNNLLSNAIKFTPEGGMIHVRLQPVGKQRFRISVTDTGLGIPLAEQDAIFEKFRQLRSNVNPDALTRETGGTGLGLSITKELCRLLEGTIQVESEVGRGSTFTIELPLRRSAVEDVQLEGTAAVSADH